MNQRGFGLVEVLAGAVIVAIAAVGVALMFGHGQAWIDAAGDKRQMLQLAQGELERYSARGYWAFGPMGPVTTTPADFPDFRMTVVVRCLNPDNFNEVWEDCLPTTLRPDEIPAKEIVVIVSEPRNRKVDAFRLSRVMTAR